MGGCAGLLFLVPPLARVQETRWRQGIWERGSRRPERLYGSSVGARCKKAPFEFVLHRLMNQTIQAHRDQILALAREHGAQNVRIFGSAARDEDTSDSDLDVLVDMEKGRSLLDHVALKQDLEDLLGCKVDVVTRASLHPQIRERILREAVSLQ